MENLEYRMIKVLCLKIKEYSDLCELKHWKQIDNDIKNKFGVKSKKECDYKQLARMLNYIDKLTEEL